MLAHLERPWPGPGCAASSTTSALTYFANGLIGFIFSATGPVAIILSVGTRGGLSQVEPPPWVFGVFFVNGLITLAMSLALPHAARLRVDHPRHRTGRPAAAPELRRGHRRLHATSLLVVVQWAPAVGCGG